MTVLRQIVAQDVRLQEGSEVFLRIALESSPDGDAVRFSAAFGRGEGSDFKILPGHQPLAFDQAALQALDSLGADPGEGLPFLAELLREEGSSGG